MVKKLFVFLGAVVSGIALGVILGYLHVGIRAASNPPSEWMNAWADFCLEHLAEDRETESYQDGSRMECLVSAYGHYEEALDSGRSRDEAAAMALLWLRGFVDQ